MLEFHGADQQSGISKNWMRDKTADFQNETIVTKRNKLQLFTEVIFSAHVSYTKRKLKYAVICHTPFHFENGVSSTKLNDEQKICTHYRKTLILYTRVDPLTSILAVLADLLTEVLLSNNTNLQKC